MFSCRYAIFIFFCWFITQPILASAANSEDSDDYDFSWLDPEKKIYVVQNRKFTKAGKVEMAFSAGLGIGEPYRSRKTIMPRLAYYFNEHWGIAATVGFNANAENSNMQALKSKSADYIPSVRDVDNFMLISALWIPFYGKINLFNSVFYLDWEFLFGLGQVGTEVDLNISKKAAANVVTASYTEFHWGTGQKFFITKHWAARLDFLAQYYKAPTAYNGTLDNSLTDTFTNYYVTLGLGYTF